MLLELKKEDLPEIGEFNLAGYAGFNSSIAKYALASLDRNEQLLKIFYFIKESETDVYTYVNIPKSRDFLEIFNILSRYGINMSSLTLIFNKDLTKVLVPSKLLNLIKKAQTVSNVTMVTALSTFIYSLINMLKFGVSMTEADKTNDEIRMFKTDTFTMEIDTISENIPIKEIFGYFPSRNILFSNKIIFQGNFDLVYNHLIVNDNKDWLIISERKDCNKIYYIITDEGAIYTNAIPIELWQLISPENLICNLVVNLVMAKKCNTPQIMPLDYLDMSKIKNVKIDVDASSFEGFLEYYPGVIENGDVTVFKDLFKDKLTSGIVATDLSEEYKDDKYAQRLYTQVQDYYKSFDLKELTNVVRGFATGKIYSMLFEGASGTGKSTAAKVIPSRCGMPYIVKNFSTNSEESDLIGTMIPNPNKKAPEDPEFKWKDGLLTKAVRNGYCFVGEEINFARPGVIGMLNSLLDESRQIELPTGEIIKAHKNFRIIVTCNIGYEGTNRLNKAFVNRFEICKKFNELSFEEICKIIKDRCGYTDITKISKIMDVYKAIKKYSNDQNLDLVISIRQLMNIFTQGQYYKSAKVALDHLLLDQAFLEDAEHLDYFKKDILENFDLNFRI